MKTTISELFLNDLKSTIDKLEIDFMFYHNNENLSIEDKLLKLNVILKKITIEKSKLSQYIQYLNINEENDTSTK